MDRGSSKNTCCSVGATTQQNRRLPTVPELPRYATVCITDFFWFFNAKRKKINKFDLRRSDIQPSNDFYFLKMVDQSAIGASSAALDVVAQCPSYAAALGYIGVAAAVCLSNWGAAVRSIF